MAPDPNPDPTHDGSLRQPALMVASATALFVGAALAALYQAARSNRPHELTYAPWVALAAAVALVLLVLSIRRTSRALRRGEVSGTRGRLLIGAAALVALPDTIMLLGAASAIPDVIGG